MKCSKCGNPNAKYKVPRGRVKIGDERISSKRIDWTIICNKCDKELNKSGN